MKKIFYTEDDYYNLESFDYENLIIEEETLYSEEYLLEEVKEARFDGMFFGIVLTGFLWGIISLSHIINVIYSV